MRLYIIDVLQSTIEAHYVNVFIGIVASMARKIYLRGGIGVGAFKKIYGGRKSNGVRPSHFAKSSGSIARHCLKQLEQLNIVEKDPKGLVWRFIHYLIRTCGF